MGVPIVVKHAGRDGNTMTEVAGYHKLTPAVKLGFSMFPRSKSNEQPKLRNATWCGAMRWLRHMAGTDFGEYATCRQDFRSTVIHLFQSCLEAIKHLKTKAAGLARIFFQIPSSL